MSSQPTQLVPPKKLTVKERREILENSLPRRIAVFGKIFEVQITNLKGLHGDCNEDTQVIRLHQALDLQAAKRTLFHEAIHAALAVSGHKYMLLEDEKDDGKHEEALVRMLEQAFADCMDVSKLAVD